METRPENELQSAEHSAKEFILDKFSNFLSFLSSLNLPCLSFVFAKRKELGLDISQELTIFIPSYLTLYKSEKFVLCCMTWEMKWNACSKIGENKMYEELKAFLADNSEDLKEVAESMKVVLPLANYLPLDDFPNELLSLAKGTEEEARSGINKIFRLFRYLGLFNNIFFSSLVNQNRPSQ